MPQDLDELSDAFAAALLEDFPEWRPFMRIVEAADRQDATVEFDVPQGKTGRSLRLSTERNEITIGFDRWHTHIGPFLGIDIEGSVATVMSMVTGFVAEDRVVQITERDGKWLKSGLCYRAFPGKPESNAATITYSWLGTYDKTVVTP